MSAVERMTHSCLGDADVVRRRVRFQITADSIEQFYFTTLKGQTLIQYVTVILIL